jgi:hypothetical protein
MQKISLGYSPAFLGQQKYFTARPVFSTYLSKLSNRKIKRLKT